jgi:hypothetical protein
MNSCLESTLPLLPQTQGSDSWATAELESAPLLDARRNKSMAKICHLLLQQPGLSFSRVVGSLRKAANRSMQDPDIAPQALLAGHVQQSAQRAQGHRLVLAASDTTSFHFGSADSPSGSRSGLGPVGTSSKEQGLLTHSVLAMTPEGVALGVVHQQSWARKAQSFGQSDQRKKRSFESKESFKWVEALEATQAALPHVDCVLLVQDREADLFELFAYPRQTNCHLLVRAAQPRKVQVLPLRPDVGPDVETMSLFEAAQQAPTVGCKTFRVKTKSGAKDKQNIANTLKYEPSIDIVPWREATLSIQMYCIQMRAPRHMPKSVPPVGPLWLIRVCEQDTPEGQEPIEWVLLCTLPIENAQQALQMVEHYCKRWIIERMHYVLKSGLGVEKLQMREGSVLQQMILLYSIVAWRLLSLLYQARQEPLSPVSDWLEAHEVEVLSAQAQTPVQTLGKAVSLIALIGGFKRCPSAPLPGLKSLWIGLRRLEGMAIGWQLARSQLLSDPDYQAFLTAKGKSNHQPKDMGQD